MKHDILITADTSGINGEVEVYITKCVNAALEAENVEIGCEISILLTDDDGIAAINRTMRGIDKATDVLSFPMFDLTPGQSYDKVLTDPETGLFPLGDMALSVERARAQALEYGHSEKREIGYLTVHSVLHLLGYDHIGGGEQKARMREREEAIMSSIEGNE